MSLDKDATPRTLHVALGNLGGRPKSWMVPPSSAASLSPTSPAELTTNPLPPTVRRRGRPPKHPRAALPTDSREIPNLHASSGYQPSSSSTSPQLANVVPRPDSASHGALPVAVLPSPTPSEEHTTRAIRELYGLGAVQMGDALSTPADPIRGERVPSQPKRPAEWQVQQEQGAKRLQFEKPGYERQTLVAGALGHREIPHGSSRPPLQLGNPMLQQAYNPTSSLGPVWNEALASLQMAQGLPASRTPSQSQQSQSSRTSAQAISYESLPPRMQPNDASTSQAQHVPLPPGTWVAMDDYLQILNNSKNHFSTSPAHPYDQGRLNLLIVALEHEDWSYLFMHQCYCMFTSAPQAMRDDLQHLPHLKSALSMMHHVLGSNEKLSPGALYFFSHFPYPMDILAATWPASFEHQVHCFKVFVFHSPKFNELKYECERRRFPPLVRELAHGLGIISFTFQHLVFIALLRSLWRAGGGNRLHRDQENEAIKIFRANQVDYHHRMRTAMRGHPVTQEDEREMQVWGSRLKGLVAKHQATLQHRNLSSVNDQHHGVSQQQQLPIPATANPRMQVQQQQAYINPITFIAEMPQLQNISVSTHSAQAAVQQFYPSQSPPTQPAPSLQTLPPATPIQQKQTSKSLLPPRGRLHPQHRLPDPARFSLHQAHLRSPILRVNTDESPMYTFTEGFIKSPTRLTQPGRTVEKWSFNLLPVLLQNMAQTVQTSPSMPGVRHVNETSKLVRLRCAKRPGSEELEEHVWAVSETSWIPNAYFKFNGTNLLPRKKVHNGKDLPIDITSLLKQEDNVLEIAVMVPTGDRSHFDYLLAIEVIGVSSHQTIKKHCLQNNHVPAEQVMQSIQDKLSGEGDDDEISIVGSTLTIGLFDPFSQAKFCEIPVRSKACAHYDCFDLETFLTSRARKGDASSPDVWKCPICNSDARPSMLLVDGFISYIQERLEARGLSRTRHIIVHRNGRWKPKAEVREGVSDRGASNASDSPVVAPASIPPHVDVIDLSN